MDDEFGTIGLTREQFRELVLNYIIGMHVRRRVALARNEEYPQLENLERHLLAFASGFDAGDLVERTNDSLYPAKKIEDLCHELLDVRDDAEFWERLGEELATRDFLANLPPDQRLAAEAIKLEPPKDLYKQYAREFDDYGIDRLAIDSSRKSLEVDPGSV
jgi:hypothetical protein